MTRKRGMPALDCVGGTAHYWLLPGQNGERLSDRVSTCLRCGATRPYRLPEFENKWPAHKKAKVA